MYSKAKWETERFDLNLSKKQKLSESTSKSEPGTFPCRYHETNRKGLNRKTYQDLSRSMFNIKLDSTCWQNFSEKKTYL